MGWKPLESIRHEAVTGAVVRHKEGHICGGDAFIVANNYGDRAQAVIVVEISNPPEWEVWVPESTKQEKHP